MADKFQLVIYESDFGLPSFDIECTKSILYSTISKLPVQVKAFSNRKLCALYSSPIFIHRNLKFTSYGDIVLYIRTLNYNLDCHLSAEECSQSLALSNYVLFKLKPVLEYIYWVDPPNYYKLTNAWYMKAVPFPFNYLHVSRLKQKALALIKSSFPKETNMEIVREYLNRDAIECFSVLSTRLGNDEYFFGNTPSSLDVLVYSYIAPMIKVPFPSSELCHLISMWPSLQKFVNRMDSKYFPNLPNESKFIAQEEKPQTSDEDVSYIAITILTVSATSLMLGFAFTRGLISMKTFL